MQGGVPVIFQGVLRDAESRTYGSPDLLIRSDVLTGLFPSVMSEEHAAVPAPDLGAVPWHYRVVDTKFTPLGLAAGGELANSGSSPAYKVQLWIYNRALGRLQGYTPPDSYLLGRGWTQTRRGEETRVHDSMDRLAPVAQEYASRGRGRLRRRADPSRVG